MSLPIPTQKNIVFSFKYLPYSLDVDAEALEFTITISEYMTLFELKKKLQEYFVKTRFKKNTSKAQSWVQPFISLHKGDGSSLSIVNDEKFVKNIIDKNKEILAHEREPFNRIGYKSGDAMKDFVLIELKMQILKKSWLFNSNH